MTTLAPGSESVAAEAGTLAGTADLGSRDGGEIADAIGAVA